MGAETVSGSASPVLSKKWRAQNWILSLYPWYCLAIRGHNPSLLLTTERQKNLGQKNESSGCCKPRSQTVIFGPLFYQWLSRGCS
jgi:hypothetical protein